MSSRGCRVEIDKVGRDEWASLLGLFDDRTIMQSWEFGEAICPGQEPSRIVVRSARGEVVAMTQVRMVRLPWVRAGMAQVAWGPLWRRRGESLDWNALEAALAALRDEYAVRRGLLLRIAPNIEADEGSRTGEVLARVGYRRTEAIRACRTIYVDLTRPLEAIRSSFTQPGRYSLRAAERKGVAVREGTSPALFDELAPLYDELLERKALRSWLDLGRWRRLQGLLPEPERPRIFVAHHGGKPVAGSVVSALGSTGYCIFLATGPEGRKLLASYLLQWRAMTWLKERGCRAYDLAGITPDEAPGTYRFKKAFGGRELSFIGTYEACRNPVSRTMVTFGEPLRAAARDVSARWRQRAARTAGAAAQAQGPVAAPSAEVTRRPASRPRILLMAVTCNPSSGSEGGTGWGRALETAKRFETWVICSGESAPEINAWFAKHGEVPSLRFHYVPFRAVELRLSRIPAAMYLAYNLWQRRAYRVARDLHARIGFDLVHQVTLATYREPGYCWKLGIPFVWGPVGGLDDYPWRFFPAAGAACLVREGTRTVANALQFRLSRRVHSVARSASALFVSNSTAKAAFERVARVTPVLMPDIGTHAVADHPARRGDRRGPLRILWIGSFIHQKAFHLLAEALRDAPPSFGYELRVLGGGPMEKRWRQLAEEAGLASRCQWMQLPHQEALRQYDWADVLAFTSLRDACGSVIAEALSRGVPIVCFDHQGVGDIVTEACGVKIPLTTPREAITRLREALMALDRDRPSLDVMGAGALRRARDLLWSREIDRTAEVYRRILERRPRDDEAPAPALEAR